MLFVSLLPLLFFALSAFSLSLSFPSSVTAGQTTSAVWTRDTLFDPVDFVLLLRNLGQSIDQGVSTGIAKSGGRQRGQIFFTFPNEGAFVLEAYSDNTLQTRLTASNPLQVVSPAAPPTGASLAPPEETILSKSVVEITFPTTPQFPLPSGPLPPALTPLSTAGDALPTGIPSNLQSNSTPQPAIIGSAVAGALVLSVVVILLLRSCRRHRRQQRSIFFREKMIQKGSGGTSWTAMTFPSAHTPNLDITVETGTLSSMHFGSDHDSDVRSPPRSKFVELIPGRALSPLTYQYARTPSPANSGRGDSKPGYSPSNGSFQIGRAV